MQGDTMPEQSHTTLHQSAYTTQKQALQLSLYTTSIGTDQTRTEVVGNHRSPLAWFEWGDGSVESGTLGAESVPGSTTPMIHSTSPPYHRSSCGTNISMASSEDLSSKNRPNTSESPHTLGDQLSPTLRSNPMSLQVICQPFDAGAATGVPSPGSTTSESGMTISSPWEQRFHQSSALRTGCGPIPIPIDIRVASRETDEKRKRNAGASARLRQRRKMREKEQAARLAYLEAQIRNQGEDVDFYRRERDELAQIIARTPGFQDVLPRPMSPQQFRASWPSAEQYAIVRPSESLDVQRRIHVGALPPPPQQPPLPMLCSWDHPDLESLLSSTFNLLS